MTGGREILLSAMVFTLGACGSSQSGFDFGPLPRVGPPQKTVEDADALVLKPEELKLTHITQTWKFNSLNQGAGLENYLRLKKRFIFPIQFDGWVSLDQVEHNYLQCLQVVSQEPTFVLRDDHNGATSLRPGDKVLVAKGKLYDLLVEYNNEASCKSVNILFGVLYGTNE